MIDTRETLSPRFEILSRERQELVWEVHYCTAYAPDRLSYAQASLGRFDNLHAEEWNAIKPWFEPRLSTFKEGHHERMVERFKEKQMP